MSISQPRGEKKKTKTECEVKVLPSLKKIEIKKNPQLLNLLSPSTLGLIEPTSSL